MPFRLITSNRLETLAEELANELRKNPAPPFRKETILVQSRGMERWISLQLAERLGICANVEFPFPKNFMSELAVKVLVTESVGDSAAFEPSVLTWDIMKILPTLTSDDRFVSVAKFIDGPDALLKRLQLSSRLADLFDQYLLYRPEMVFSWEAGKEGAARHEPWQARLWRSLRSKKKVPHRADLGKKLIAALQRKSHKESPDRLAVFGISSLPPFHIDVFKALSSHCDVTIYLLNPCRKYWGDIASRKEIRRIEKKAAKSESQKLQGDLFSPAAITETLHLEEGNRLLASMGELGRDFLNTLMDTADEDRELFSTEKEGTLLQALQNSILDLEDLSVANARSAHSMDSSVQIHSCHSRRREIEVLHDHLLDFLQNDPALRPRDIVVMAPDIEPYAPFVQAVFDLPGEDHRRIPFSIADRSYDRESAIVDTFMTILGLHAKRLTATEVLNILEMPAIRHRFRLTEESLELITHWIRETRIRWGIDSEHRAAFGLPSYAQNTWKHGLDRLLLGYALPAGDLKLYSDRTLPFDDIEGDQADVLNGLLAFTRALFTAVNGLNRTRPLRAWSQFLLEIFDTLFTTEGPGFSAGYTVRKEILALATYQDATGFEEDMDIRSIRHYLRTRLRKEGYGFGYITGGVTFCSMLPMRSIPFKVICLIGMNHDAYPRRDNSPEFDLIAANPPRPGDRSRRKDDRYLFLETLISARDILYISYVGQNIRDNSIIPPSVVVSELTDSLETFLQKDGDNRQEERFTITHKLQPFSPVYFKSTPADTNHFSYSRENFEAAGQLNAREPGAEFFQETLPEPEEEYRRVDIKSLCTFFRNPCKFLLNRRLNIYLPGDPRILENKEAFKLTGLDRYQIAEELLHHFITEKSRPVEAGAFLQSGILPHGVIGEIQLQELKHRIRCFVEQTNSVAELKGLETLDVNKQVGEFTLTGNLENITQQGMIQFRYGRLRARDHVLSWILHLILNISYDIGPRQQTLLVGLDSLQKGNWRGYRFKQVAEPEEKLLAILRAYWYGLARPLRFFPEAALAYSQSVRRNGIEKVALGKAASKWHGNQQIRGEIDDPYFRHCFRNIDDPFDKEFKRAAAVITDPLLQYSEEIDW